MNWSDRKPERLTLFKDTAAMSEYRAGAKLRGASNNTGAPSVPN